MTSVPLTVINILIGFLLLSFGIIYSYLIYKRPFEPHLTWVSVGIGIFFTEVGIWTATFVTVERVDFQWWLIWYVVGGYLLTGGPMIAGQVIKHYKEKKNNKAIKKQYGKR